MDPSGALTQASPRSSEATNMPSSNPDDCEDVGWPAPGLVRFKEVPEPRSGDGDRPADDPRRHGEAVRQGVPSDELERFISGLDDTRPNVRLPATGYRTARAS